MVVQMDNDIVIAGISGRLPESSNMEEFKENLMKRIDMVTDDDESRWSASLYGLPPRFGKIKDLSNFDASFFKVHAQQARVMDPQIRVLLEATYEAIVDAGVNPSTLRGSRIGVFVGASAADAKDFWIREGDQYGLLGCLRTMFANRVSFVFDFIGPSCTIDCACSSAFNAMHDAVVAIRNGECDAAIVGGLQIMLDPGYIINFQKLNTLSQDGKCKVFDAAANGYARSEAVVAIYLQKATDARRAYASIIGSTLLTDGYKPEGITYPNGKIQHQMLREVYNKLGINPADVVYVEAHGTGTKTGDPIEVNTIDKIFCKDRKSPLLIGSVKSNMGHSESASALCSVAKVLIAMETGVIPANLHFVTPNPDIPGLCEGRIRVVDVTTPWNGGLVGISAFGFGGTNSHVILRSNPKLKLPPTPDTDIESLPKLLVVSGSTEEAVHVLLDKANEYRRDSEFISLLHAVYRDNIAEHRIRGYGILNDDGTREMTSQITDRDEKRPIWFIFSGMGSQWPGMGRDLLVIETCRRSLRKCADTLTSRGVDLMNIIENGTNETYENVTNSLMAIVAIQIALVDLLTSLGIHPDGIIGHSVGELACGYADGTLTLEQTISMAYCRGKALVDTNLKLGAMAVVGLSWEEIKKICPADVSPACDNSADLVTISGAIEPLQKFIEALKSKGVFTKMVDSSGIAFHSEHIAPAVPRLRSLFDQVISNPKKRSARWISTSIPEAKWDGPLAQFNSSEYHTNNMLSPVLLREAMKYIPEDAITIEIAPHCLLQTILRRSLPLTVTNISLHKRDQPNNIYFLLSNLGKLYMAGAQPDVSKLYKPVSFPVGRGTPMLGPLVKWDHSIKWEVPSFKQISRQSEQHVVEIDLSKEENAYLIEHKIDGRSVFPGSKYIVMVWKAFAKLRGVDFERLSVIFENLRFRRITILLNKKTLKFSINILEETGEFEICESGAVIVSGNICEAAKGNQLIQLPPLEMLSDKNHLPLSTEEIYKELRLRGYDYGDSLKAIKVSNNNGTVGEIFWTDKWDIYVDAMLQFNTLVNNRRLVYASQIRYIVIDPILHKRQMDKLSENEGSPIYVYKNVHIIKSGGIEFRGVKNTIQTQQKIHAKPKCERYTFMPYESPHGITEDPKESKMHALAVLLQIMSENTMSPNIKIVEFAGERAAEALLAPFILDILNGEILLVAELRVAVISSDNYTESLKKLNLNVDTVKIDLNSRLPAQDVHLAVAADILSKQSSNVLKNLAASLRPGCFILLEETTAQFDLKIALKQTGLISIGKHVDSVGKNYFLLKKITKERESIVVHVTEKDLSWLENVKAALKKYNSKEQEVIIVSQGEEFSGLIGFMNCIRYETENVRYVLIQDINAPKFDPSAPFYAEQLNRGLIANVLKEGQWGSYRFLQLDDHCVQVKHAYLNALIRGDLTTLRWIQSPLNYHLFDKFSNTICSVYYAALNFRDIMLLNNKLSLDIFSEKMSMEDCLLGMEFSGREPSGRRVMGIVETRGLATTVLTNPGLLWEVPNQWTLEQAATIPIVYATAYYALFVRGKLKIGESVLIHAGTSCVGQAAITVALYTGCVVFTTTSSTEKREYLKKIFPQLNDRYIGSSRDTSFEQMVLNETQGCGVDVVLNSLSEEKLQASVRCLAKNGRFLDIDKYDFLSGNRIDMSMFLKNTTFNGILIETLFEDRVEQEEVRRLVADGIKNGTVRPLTSTVFSEPDIEQGFRFMSAGKHIGKVLLKIRDEEPQKCVPPSPKLVTAMPRTYFNPKKSYVVIGGLGGCGLEVANWIVNRGARFIVLTSRSGVRNGYQSLCMRFWRENGITVVVSKADATTLSGAECLIDESNRVAPIGGIFQLAAVLHDVLFENLREADFKRVTQPKVDITRNLDAITRKSCPSLDYFVVFSSTVSGRGNFGQSNYGYASSAAERIMERRHADGLPGQAIQWGAIGDVGLRPDAMKDEIDENDTSGTALQRIASCLATMDSFLQQHHPVVSSLIKAQKDKSDEKDDSEANVIETIVNILGIKDINLMNPDDSFERLGMDSLIYTAIRQVLKRERDIVLSSQEIRNLTINKLRNLFMINDKTSETRDSPATEERRSFAANGSVPAAKLNGHLADPIDDSPRGNGIPEDAIVRMKTKSDRGPTLFIIHGIESLTGVLKDIVKELERPLWTLENIVQTDDMIPDMAEHYLNIIRSVQKKGPYHVAGYSYGTLFAFEIATKLESAGEEVVLTMIDGSPIYVQLHAAKKFGRIDTNKNFTLRDYVKILACFSINFNNYISFLRASNILKESKSDLEILEKMSELLRGTPISVDDLKINGRLFMRRLIAASVYEPKNKFNGPVTLMKASETYIDIDDDYDLSTICTQPVKVKEIPGDHKTMLLGKGAKMIANILNIPSKS